VSHCDAAGHEIIWSASGAPAERQPPLVRGSIADISSASAANAWPPPNTGVRQ